MSRADFENRLLHDATLRQGLDDLRELGLRVRALEGKLTDGRQELHRLAYALKKAGVPNSLVAGLVGVSPQRIGTIMQEQEGRP